MLNKAQRFSLLSICHGTLVLLISVSTWAQDTLLDPSEMPPQEPPYTTNAPRKKSPPPPQQQPTRQDELFESEFEEELVPQTQDTPPNEPPYVEPDVYDPLQETQAIEVAEEPVINGPPKDVVVRDLLEKKANGTYYYRYERKSTDRWTGHFKLGVMSPPAISTLVGGEYELTYKEMYTSAPVPILTYETEWALFENWPGLRAQGGIGGFFAQGNGRFARDVLDGDGLSTNIAKEKYTFIGFPLSAGLVLRLQMGKSWFVPFANGGATYTGLLETRDDNAKRNILATPSFYGGGGIMINTTALDRDAGFIFDRDYRIANLWVTAEGRIVKSLSRELDVSSNIIFVGLAADY